MKKSVLAIFLWCSITTNSWTTDINSYLSPSDHIIGLLNQTIDAIRYWEMLQVHPLKRTFSRPLRNWMNFSWHTEIAHHIEELSALQQELAETLALIHNPEKKDRTYLQTLTTKTAITLHIHGIPSHLQRNWMKYAIAAVSTAFITYHLIDMLNNRVVFRFSVKNKSIFKEIDRNLKELPHTPESSLRFHSTIVNSHGIIWTHKSHVERIEEKLKELLERNDIVTYEKKQLPLFYLFYYLYNEDGISFFHNFFEKCFYNPIEKIRELFLDTPTKRRMVGVGVVNVSAELKEKMVNTLVKANKTEKYAPFLQHYNDDFKNMSLDQLKKIIETLANTSDALQEQLATLHSYATTHKDTSWGIKGWVHWAAIPNAPDDIASIASDCLKLTYIDIPKLKIDEISKNIDDIWFTTQLLTQIGLLTPSIAIGVGTYKGLTKTYSFFYKKRVIDPLVRDLKDFEHFLYQHRNGGTEQLTFKGMSRYWIETIKKYVPKIMSNYRIYFERDVEKLGSDITIEHQLTIISSLLHYGIKHF